MRRCNHPVVLGSHSHPMAQGYCNHPMVLGRCSHPMVLRRHSSNTTGSPRSPRLSYLLGRGWLCRRGTLLISQTLLRQFRCCIFPSLPPPCLLSLYAGIDMCICLCLPYSSSLCLLSCLLLYGSRLLYVHLPVRWGVLCGSHVLEDMCCLPVGWGVPHACMF